MRPAGKCSDIVASCPAHSVKGHLMTTNVDRNDASRPAQMLFKELFLASPDAIVVTDFDGHISAANPGVEQLFGYSQARADREACRNSHTREVSRSSSPAPQC